MQTVLDVILILMGVLFVVALIIMGFTPGKYYPLRVQNELFRFVSEDNEDTWQCKLYCWCEGYVILCVALFVGAIVLGCFVYLSM